MAKPFERDGVEYVKYTMDVPKALMDLLDLTYGKYGKSGKICEILMSVLAGVDLYDVELQALQAHHAQINQLRQAIVDQKQRQHSSLCLAVEQVQQALYAEQAAAQAEEVAALTAAQAEEDARGLDFARAYLDEHYSVPYDLGPIPSGDPGRYLPDVNRALEARGLSTTVSETWVADYLETMRQEKIRSISRLDISDDEVRALSPQISDDDDLPPEVLEALRAIRDRIEARGDPARIGEVMQYILYRAGELGV